MSKTKTEDFITADQEQQIITAIRNAEKATSGEIRIHIENHTSLDVLDRAKEIFYWLQMNNTTECNGVLIYVAVKDHRFAIFGDQGIHNAVTDNFWEITRDSILKQFKTGNFAQGLVDGILTIGEQLQHYFPKNANDSNELANDISKG